MILSLAILAFLIYSNTLEGPFILDDGLNIQSNPHIRLTRLTLEGITRAALGSPCPNRPVANISFALNYFFHQYNVMGYHVVNILIHIITGILLYLFAGTTLGLPSLRSRNGPHGWIPFFTALIWLVHPIQTQSTTYIVQRMNSMAAMFYVLSFLLYVRARLAEEKKKKRMLFAGCILAGILAVGSKEIAATLPFFILLYEWYFFRDLSRPWLKRHLLLFGGIVALLAIAAFVYLGAHPVEKILSGYTTRDFTLTQRVLTESRVVVFYISLLIFPHPSRLNLEHDFSLSYSLIDPMTTMLSMGAIAALIALAFYLAKKERLISFSILWFLGNLVMESSLIALEIIFEHRTYLPSMLVGLMAVTAAYRHIKPKWLPVAVLCAAVTLCSVWTYERNNVWSDEVTLWRDCVAKSPGKARPRNNLGGALTRRGRTDEAIKHYLEALSIRPDYERAHNNLGIALKEQGRIDEAIEHHLEALRINPDREEAHNYLGITLKEQGRIDEAVKHYLEALRINPDYEEAHNNLGIALKEQGRTDEAIKHYLEALRINPDHAEAHNNLGVALKEQGRIDEAIGHYLKALRTNPDLAEAHYNLGNALEDQGRIDEAVKHYLEELRVNPDHAEAHNNLGIALFRKGHMWAATVHFREALRIKPDYVDAKNNLNKVLTIQRKGSD